MPLHNMGSYMEKKKKLKQEIQLTLWQIFTIKQSKHREFCAKANNSRETSTNILQPQA